ncbi:MAG TPA: MBL fold metallo-hydrolase [Vicinamibacterales bacterium]|nr:MBL fold metallo-hydrolase [Vicinamibacterales bacterium]
MRFWLVIGTTAALLLPAARTYTQQPGLRMKTETLVQGPMRIDKVKDGLYVVRGPFLPCAPRGCTPNGTDDGLIHEAGDVAVRVTPEGVILVDDKFPEHVATVLDLVRTITPLPIKYMLNSHHHGDHVSGNIRIAEQGINIVGHKNIRENFIKTRQPGPPNITFADEAAVYLGTTEVKLHYFGRGHTNGDTVIEFPDLKTIHIGDLIIDGMPVIDYPNGGSAIEFVTTIDRVLTLDFDTMIPGHGRVMTKDDARAYRARFQAMNDRGRALIKKGVSKDRFGAELKLDDFGWEKTVSTIVFVRGLGQYYDELAGSR